MLTVLSWPARRPPQPLGPNQIHVWAWSLEDHLPHRDCSQPLDEDELTRWRGFRFERDRTRFWSAHSTLRSILAAYHGAKPEDLKFQRNAFGKPELMQGSGADRRLCFNLSHSGPVALLAISPGSPVGIDIEQVAQTLSSEPDVAETHFSVSERSELGTLEGDLWLQGFYHCWTQKEAVLKAEGIGLNLDLSSFDVSVDPKKPAGLLRSKTGLQASWNLMTLSPGPGIAGAIAYRNPQAEICCFQLGAQVFS